ncbi:MAG: endolytic transglycosylase MltG [Mariprofundus sp.]|nr:endolytic transglycosylase MltG [Mariprofundus sp.]
MRKMVVFVVILLLLVLLVSGGLFYQQLNRKQPVKAVDLLVPVGASSGQIARLLEQHQLIRSALSFRLWLRIKHLDQSLRSGVYHFEKPATMLEVIERLQQGDVMRFTVTVPEGLRSDEVLQLLADKTAVPLQKWRQALTTLVQGDSEGLLLPETWQYNKPLDAKRLLRTMIKAQQSVLDSLTMDSNEQMRLRIMASILEKETSLERERPLVSAAIHNRLRIGMPLQMDPTVIYGIYRTQGAFSGNIHRADLKKDTPWNSYTRKGLPPTPICNPGRASLLAAAAPAAVDYLYFVADGSGGHAFATTLAEHDRNVRQWVALERKRSHGK